MKIELLKEPKLEFGNDFICDDPKKGISVGGFFSSTNNQHRSEVRFSIIGRKNDIQNFNDWINRFKNYIEASASEIKIKNEAKIEDGEVQNLLSNDDETSQELKQLMLELEKDIDRSEDEKEEYAEGTYRINKKLNPDFIGFNKETSFNSEFINDELNNFIIRQDEIDSIIKSDNSDIVKSTSLIALYKNAYIKHIDNFNVKADICIVIIPSEIFSKYNVVQNGRISWNFRRKLKAEIIMCNKSVPVQLVLEDTITGKKKQMQDDSMIAWNFVVAQYYKTDAIPWSLTNIDQHSCFVGISFHKVLDPDKNLMRSSIAQAFNREGKGLVFVGKQFEWDVDKNNTPAPHLTHDYANDLIKSVINLFIAQNRNVKPTRVVIHKTTDFWNSSINADYAEVEGLKYGIQQVLGNDVEIDLVSIRDSDIKLFRSVGKYPVIRGTLLEIDKSEGVLYTTGYIPYFETFPGVHMPLGKHIKITEGETTLRKVCEEIMALTKMNFNNCNYYDSLPITLKFAQKVGEVIQYLPEGFEPPSKYYYYM